MTHLYNLVGQPIEHTGDETIGGGAFIEEPYISVAEEAFPMEAIRWYPDETGEVRYYLPADFGYENAFEVTQEQHDELVDQGYRSLGNSTLIGVGNGLVIRTTGVMEGGGGMPWWMKWMLKIALAVAVAQIAIAAGPLLLRIIENSKTAKAISDQVKRFEPTINTIKDRLEKEQSRISGLLDTSIVRNSLAALRIAHQVGLRTSDQYRKFLDDLYSNTRDLSRQVFGEASQLSSALGLLRLSVADLTALKGERVDVGDQRWFTESQDLLTYVEENSSRYHRSPERFWSDLNIHFIDPILSEARRENDQRWVIVDEIRDGLNVAKIASDAITDRFDEYRTELDHFLSPENRRNLDALARDFDRRIRLPLASVSSVVRHEFPPIKAKVIKIEAVNVNQQEEIDTVTELTADPDDLEAEAQELQQTRFSRILGSGLPADLPVPDLRQAVEDVAFIKRELPVN